MLYRVGPGQYTRAVSYVLPFRDMNSQHKACLDSHYSFRSIPTLQIHNVWTFGDVNMGTSL
jgi:hypothetical protein